MRGVSHWEYAFVGYILTLDLFCGRHPALPWSCSSLITDLEQHSCFFMKTSKTESQIYSFSILCLSGICHGEEVYSWRMFKATLLFILLVLGSHLVHIALCWEYVLLQSMH